jgi:hypothetical protein
MHGLRTPSPTHIGPPSRIQRRPFAKPANTISGIDGFGTGVSMGQDDNRRQEGYRLNV